MSSSSDHQTIIRPFMPELDSVRGVAILLVLFFHGYGYVFATSRWTGLTKIFLIATQGGWIGVNLFFVLSGFLITGILLDSKQRPRYFRKFYARRALRILPAYYALLLILLITPLTFVAVQRSVGWRFVALSAIYLSNVTSLFGVDPQYVALWSLAVEEQFYLVWPAIVRFLSARALLGCILLVLVGSPVLRAVAFQSGQGEPGYTWLVGDGLALGALLSLLLRQTWPQRATARFFASACLAIGGIILAVGFHFGIVRGSTLIGATLRPTALNFLLAALMTAVLLIGSSPYPWLVNWKWLRFLGTISYGLYLIHMLVFDVVDALADKFLPTLDLHSSFGLLCLRFLVASALAITMAYLSRTYFEEWFLRLKNRV